MLAQGAAPPRLLSRYLSQARGCGAASTRIQVNSRGSFGKISPLVTTSEALWPEHGRICEACSAACCLYWGLYSGPRCELRLQAREHAGRTDRLLRSKTFRIRRLLGTAFDQAKRVSEKSQALRVAREFMTDRRACGTDKSCILKQYVAALASYQDLGATIAIPKWISAMAIAGNNTPAQNALPARIGDCATTQVTGVTPRLDSGHPPTSEDYDSGTAIDFANGGHQVSYGREQALLDSKPGDTVLMCLISVPRGCPPGDNRGRVYLATNTRTNQTWSLPDSQHRCGGA